MNVRITDDDAKIFYDVTKIKNITESIASRYGNIPHAASLSDKSTVAQNGADVNTPPGHLSGKTSNNQVSLSLNTGVLDAQNQRDTDSAINYLAGQLVDNGPRAAEIAKALGSMQQAVEAAQEAQGIQRDNLQIIRDMTDSLYPIYA